MLEKNKSKTAHLKKTFEPLHFEHQKKYTGIRKIVSKFSPVERSMFRFFLLSNFLIYMMLLYFWDAMALNGAFVSALFMIITVGGSIQVLLFRYFYKVQREKKLYQKFNHYSQHLVPIMNIIEKKEVKLFQMTTELKNNFPKTQDELEHATQSIINECFIQLNFTKDAVLNSIFLKYYILFQSRKIELKTQISSDLYVDSKRLIEFYELVEFGFEQMLWIVGRYSGNVRRPRPATLEREGLISSYNLSKILLKKVNLVIVQNKDSIHYACSFSGEIKDIMKLAEHLEKEKRKAYVWKWKRDKVFFEISPDLVMLKATL